MNDWLATGISYGILLLIAENTQSAELAPAIAWGLAAVVFVRNLGALRQKFPGIIPATPATPPQSGGGGGLNYADQSGPAPTGQQGDPSGPTQPLNPNDSNTVPTLYSGTGPVPVGSRAGLIQQALALAGQPQSWADQIAWIVSHEDASWDPFARNPVPVGPAGEHATGIMQMLPSTFQHYNAFGTITNPLDNLVAGIRYIADTYGSPFNPTLVRNENAGIGY